MVPEGVVRWLEEHRELLVCVFCLPASFIFTLVLQARALLRRLTRTRTRHDDRVRVIQAQVQEWKKLPAEGRCGRLLCTSRPNWLSLSTTFFQKQKHHRVDIPLYDVLALDEAAMSVRVEPMVTIGDITDYLIPRGYSLAVTIELVDATLGGLAFGTGMSTHSHKVGLYHETIMSYEVVLGDGSLVTATATNDHSDLFKALHWSHGSLGFLVALTLKIVKIKPYIKLTYTPVQGQKKYCDMLREYSGANEAKPQYFPDYIEGTIFSSDSAVIMTGDYSEYDRKVPVNHCSRWYKPWFYKHVQSFLQKGESVELIPLRDYLLRHNRSIFWVVEDMISFGNNPIFRFLLGWLLPPKPAFLKFTTTPGVRAYTFTKQVFQDIVLPLQELERQIEIATELFDKYPLLVYPCRIIDHGPMSGQLGRPPSKYLVPGTDYAMYNDLGVYGVPGKVKDKKSYNPVAAMRAMEQFTRELGGYSFLYADIFMTGDEFQQMFDLSLYAVVRRKYHAEGAFPHLYDKVKPEINVFAIGDANTTDYAEAEIK
ncbi:delta(24)-sterol reductase-like isoform X3 [Leptidea sinapis]|uniref:delta(24)-sterol reductase-like isoform X1 n=1 Tax=Leptidea sinapis TaxID=189913 RepID=UPI0021424CF1|nr:delta(24)-sterol reductase-like isoform X1 [Leptidea sinapis]XP_050668270.1 delta(24)-sterol reductase-like isoform X1 [Leptidea sinapis]XP_050668271.1 delta(24)-sterol reductase-like isoform X2 [Leptidea sinapis]XP_050668272.1 delta(24)-sterol reductase-like isoform X3 [Leptidea sinapis]XP_050668273.1 delta(24)-sterol reductase-like isoform X3 [Leptidea sinapis]XP_050668274.1 delta(24)-sterol reductase-like isoform X3 [Leptidea sinapis]